MTIGERIKLVRKENNLTQEKFAERIHTSRSNLGNIETDTFAVQDRILFEICREFDVNREWLETGDGEMFRVKSRDEEIAEWAASLGDVGNEFKRRFVYALTKLNEDGWEVIERFAQTLYDEQMAENEQTKKDEGK